MGNIHKFKILAVTSTGSFIGGGERSFAEFVRFAKSKGANIEVVVPSDADNKFVGYFDSISVPVHRGKYLENERDISENSSAVLSYLNKLFLLVKADIIINNLYMNVSLLSAAMLGLPIIHFDRGAIYMDNDAYPKSINHQAAKYSNHIFCNSAKGDHEFQKLYGIEKTSIVYSYTAKPDVKLLPSDSEDRIVLVSRISPEKNIIEVVRALHIIKKDKPNIKLAIIGGGYDSGLNKYICDSGLVENVDFLGHHGEPWKIVRESDIYINCSLIESVGRSSVEAIRLGIPTLVSNILGHFELINDIGVESYELGHEEDLANKVLHILNDRETTRKRAEVSRLKAEEFFTEDRCNNNALQVIESVCEQNNPMEIEVYNDLADIFRAKKIDGLVLQISSLTSELNSHLGIKRSLRLFLGNVKRKFLGVRSVKMSGEGNHNAKS